MAGVEIGSTLQKKLLLQRISEAWEASSVVGRTRDRSPEDEQVLNSLIQEIALCFGEMLGDKPTLEDLQRCKETFFDAAKVDRWGSSHGGDNRERAERVYTQILEIIISRTEETARKLDFNQAKEITDIVEQARGGYFPKTR
jgi:hypothetical protein